MNNPSPTHELIEGLAARLCEKLEAAQADAASNFVRRYFKHVDPDDLQDTPEDDLYGTVASHWQFIQQRSAGQPKVRAFNPSFPNSGWQSRHTIIEIVNDDMPFLVDSLTTEINRQGLTLHLIIHPVLAVQRDEKGHLLNVAAVKDAPDLHRESVIHAEVDRHSDPQALERLQAGILRVLSDVRAAVEDWQTMLGRLGETIEDLGKRPPPQSPEQNAEDTAFLKWIADGNFTMLGYRSYALQTEAGEDVLRIDPNSGLGILRGGDEVSSSFANLSAEVRAQARDPRLLIVTKSNTRATVHRSGYLDYIGVKRFDDQGAVIGEHRFLGLFTSTAYNTNPWRIPLLRQKVTAVVDNAGFVAGSHAAKALQVILEQYPRDELIQASVDELLATATGVQRLGERQRTRLFIRRDVYNRFYSCQIFIPRDSYDTDLRVRIQNILMDALGGTSCEHNVLLSESVLARIHLIVRLDPQAGVTSAPDVRHLEERISAAARRWADALSETLDEAYGEEKGAALLSRYRAAFPAAYREAGDARSALYDISLIEAAGSGEGVAVSLYVPPDAAQDELRVKLVCIGSPIALSHSMPMLEHMGVRVIDERPYHIRRSDSTEAWIHDFGLRHPSAREQSLETLRTLFHDAFLQIWRGEIENDHFNQLVLAAGLDWRQVKVLRAYAKYMRQAGMSFSFNYIELALRTYRDIARMLVALFESRFDPALADAERTSRTQKTEADIHAALDKVANLDDDRILRQYLALILATLRTSYYQREGGDVKQYLSFKFDPAMIPGLPEPRPKFEIFVFSPRIEGVHLRGGLIARGGLRWSDRMEDFRTEVLGLVKAQRVKNAVIVPTGSKGGFVVKRSPPASDREAYLKEGIACYQTYLQGLLDLTDNLVEGKVVPPPSVVRHDGDDPYLVVAADKGTATFSDTANAVARRYGFWLDDAFASGGSAGYDHKKMGITARGAWESVKRHFRELGVDTQNEDFTVVGVGDMSGDVFGNGMLLSKHIRLQAAFDHRHIFIDPNPDSATSYVERERMFALPRSSWEDYDKSLISQGGGIWPRTAKSITLSAEAREALGIEAETLTPTELITGILKAPAGLLYLGGIGTYVKATDETHLQVGDRANDVLRVNGNELRCKVIGEGGNLGFTQKGRIEFAMNGGRVYTDAIDNSAGVDCSDHEINIKILLNAVVAAGDMTGKQRDTLLAQMTDEVAALVLQDNIQQTRILNVMAADAAPSFEDHTRYMRHLEKGGKLVRRLEYLPNDDAITERRAANLGLTLPELAVLLAYSKIDFYDQVLGTNAPDDEVVGTLLYSYFPEPLRERFAASIAQHPLRREIVATCAINEIINHTGCTFAFNLAQETGASAGDIVRAYTIVRDAFGLHKLWHAIDGLGATVPAPKQRAMLSTIGQHLERSVQWLLRRPAYLADMPGSIARFAAVTGGVERVLDDVLKDSEREAFHAAIEGYVSEGVPAELARHVVGLAPLFSALDITEIDNETGQGPESVAAAYFDLVNRLDLYWLNQQIHHLPASGHWQALARDALRDDLSSIAATLTGWVFRQCDISAGKCDANALINAWAGARESQIARFNQLSGELRQSSTLDLAMVSVVLRELKALARP